MAEHIEADYDDYFPADEHLDDYQHEQREEYENDADDFEERQLAADREDEADHDPRPGEEENELDDLGEYPY